MAQTKATEKSPKATDKSAKVTDKSAKVTDKSAKAATPGAPDPRRMTPPRTGVKVRMYRTGLGDCFLLAFPRRKSARKGERDAFYMLIDCGACYLHRVPNFPEKTINQHVRDIAEDIRAATGGRIDRLVITHEHWDHVSGFHPQQAREIFENIELGRLWMAWTEDREHDPLAERLHSARQAMRLALARSLQKMDGLARARGAGESDHEAADLARKVLAFFGGPDEDAPVGPAAPDGLLAATTIFGVHSVMSDDAMTWLRDTYGEGRVDYLRPGRLIEDLDGVDDARVYVLGPPEDEELILRYNPGPSTASVFDKSSKRDGHRFSIMAALESAFFASFGVVPTDLRAGAGSETVRRVEDAACPFEEHVRIPVEAAKMSDDPFYRDRYYKVDPWRAIEEDWLEAVGSFALQLDNATNNTSLALAIEIGPRGGGKILLFPGDAQVGNWESWFGPVVIDGQAHGKPLVWKDGDREFGAEDLLRRTVLYKVGHHGSHNATLRDSGLFLMGAAEGSRELVAMLPVNEFIAQAKAGYGEMPLTSLVRELLIRTDGRLMRSDEDLKVEEPTDPEKAKKQQEKYLFRTVDGVQDERGRMIRRRDTFQNKVKTDLFIEYTVA